MTWEELLEKADLYEYVAQYVELEFKNNEWWGYSPFKSENTPSFSIRPEQNVWKDFASGKGGNIYNFIMEYHKVDFRTAISLLTAHLDIYEEVSYTSPPEIIKVLKRFKPPKKAVLNKKQILSENSIDKYAKKEISWWLEEGISQEVIDRYKVRFDNYSESIVFPIWSNKGNIIAIKGRRVGKDFKELGLSKYFYMNKIGKLDFIYNYWQRKDDIKQCGYVVVFESEKSVMKMESWHYENTIALCNGYLTDEQLWAIIQLDVRVVFALDKDKDVRKDENVKKLSLVRRVEFIKDVENVLGDKDSPCDKGREVYDELYRKRVRF